MLVLLEDAFASEETWLWEVFLDEWSSFGARCNCSMIFGIAVEVGEYVGVQSLMVYYSKFLCVI